ncbi:hypothetical protein QNH47_12715 [Virgibacillus halodenitrificans]|nr:hypothetical protein [Virgibacillus halodenitrificans]WHX25029.1 hypothetical protein QNH47_12715 [Virgibacillus halodenitrificans]
MEEKVIRDGFPGHKMGIIKVFFKQDKDHEESAQLRLDLFTEESEIK